MVIGRAWLVGLVVGIACFGLPASTSARDFDDPAQRTRRGTAYALDKGQWSTEAELLGVTTDDLFGRIGLGYGFGKGVQLDTNVAHIAVGLLNVELKWNFLDFPHFGMSASVGVIWGHGAWIWILDGLEQRIIRNTEIVVLPMSLWASSHLLDWLQVDFGIRYTHSQVFGDFESDSTLADGEIGIRQLSVLPSVRFYIVQTLELFVGARLPLYSAIPGAGEANTSLGEGVYAGARTGTIDKPPFSQQFQLQFGARSAMAKTTFVTASIHYGKTVQSLYGSAFYPAFGVEYRF